MKRFKIDPDQAKLVIRIFELSASNGYSTVANTLNEELVVNPSPASADGKWTASGIREILQRELYRGVAVDGKSRWVYEDGTARKVRTAPAEWKRRDAPELKIVEPELWDRAHAQLAQTRAAYIRNNQGHLQSKPETATDAKHLLSGFLRCGSCGAKLVAVKRKNRRGVPSVTFACYNHRQAKARCANSHGLPAELIQETVVWRLTHNILTPALLDRCLADLATRAAGAPERIAEQRSAIDSRLAKLDAEVKRLVALAASGAAADTFLAGITEREAERRDLRAKLERLDGQDKAISQDAETVEALQGAILCWQSYMGQDSPQPGRAVLRKLGIERIVVNHQDDPEWPWSFTVRGSFENAITGRVYQAQETQAQLDEAEAWFAERVAEEDGEEDGAADECSHNPAVALRGTR